MLLEHGIFPMRVAALIGVAMLCTGAMIYASPLDDLRPGEWYEVPNSRLFDKRPDGWKANVVVPWSGGAYDTKRDRLIVWGGGHRDYAGNEIYTFDVNTLEWERLTDPSPNTGGTEVGGLYPDGLPRARHTYDYIEYVPNIDRFLSLGAGGTYPSSQVSDPNLHAFDFDTLTWDSSRANLPTGKGSRGTGAYNPADGLVWYNDLRQLQSYDPLVDSWTEYPNAKKNLNLYAMSAIDPSRSIMVAIGGRGSTKQMYKWDLSNPNAPPVNLLSLSSGPNDLTNDTAPGFVYDPVSDKFVAWSGSASSWGPGADVYLLDPDTWEWTRSSPAATNTVIPTKPAGASSITGTYGRFQYVPSKNVFILVNSNKGNVFFYKLTANPIPEPSTMLLGLMGVGILYVRHHQR